MKTTLDLPEDVALTLRLESARRGGRRTASYSKLVADAVRKTYGGSETGGCSIDWKEGRVVVGSSGNQQRVTSEEIRDALSE